jgi:hypothetical protein
MGQAPLDKKNKQFFTEYSVSKSQKNYKKNNYSDYKHSAYLLKEPFAIHG